jgi:hypothetical protein
VVRELASDVRLKHMIGIDFKLQVEKAESASFLTPPYILYWKDLLRYF